MSEERVTGEVSETKQGVSSEHSIGEIRVASETRTLEIGLSNKAHA